MKNRDWRSDEEKLREERIQEINKFFDSFRKKTRVLIFSTPNPPRINKILDKIRRNYE